MCGVLVGVGEGGGSVRTPRIPEIQTIQIKINVFGCDGTKLTKYTNHKYVCSNIVMQPRCFQFVTLVILVHLNEAHFISIGTFGLEGI